MTIPVLFLNPGSTVHRGVWWDQTIVEWMLRESRHDLTTYEGSWAGVPNTDGIVLVIHAESGTDPTEHIAKLNERLARYRWVLLIVTSDETDRWPWWTIQGTGHMIVWRQHPTTSTPDRILPLGPPPHAIDMPSPDGPRDLDWFFAGQITHDRRRECADALRGVPHGEVVETDAFLTGLPVDEYMSRLATARVAPAPSGPYIADTFRLYEALESGCVPIADPGPAERWTDPEAVVRAMSYHRRAFHTPAPYPVAAWSDQTLATIKECTRDPGWAVTCEAWWQLEKRNLTRRFDADLSRLSGSELGGLTAIVTTSPIPSHPDPAITVETVESILERVPDGTDVIVAADGVRPEQSHMADDYHAYLAHIVRMSRTTWKGRAWVDYTGRWGHQANTTRHALNHVWTPFLLFAEHDTPLIGDIPFDRLTAALDVFDVVRLHHEASVHPEHRHLNHGPLVGVGPDTFQPTVQWSQRPHLARVETYRRILDEFPSSSRTMIEDKLHSVAQVKGWRWLRTAIFHPDGDIKRSTHTDGRAGEPKWQMVFE